MARLAQPEQVGSFEPQLGMVGHLLDVMDLDRLSGQALELAVVAERMLGQIGAAESPPVAVVAAAAGAGAPVRAAANRAAAVTAIAANATAALAHASGAGGHGWPGG